MANPFTLDDFRTQFPAIQKMGLKNAIRQMPGMGERTCEGEDPDVAILRVIRMIDAMTAEERANPKIVDAGRCERIAATANVQPKEVNDLLRQFEHVQAVMERMQSMSLWDRIKLVLGIRRFPLPPPPEA